jgi:DNA-directed RNA polymerase specialized sigma24 family protein
VACRRKFEAWKRAWHRSVASARGILLAVIGIALLTAGILLASADLGPILVVLGVGVLALGIVLPLVGEVVVGPGGSTFRFREALRERDGQLQPFVLAENETRSLQWFARLLTGDAERGPALVEEALARTYRVWTDIPERDLNLHVLCALVRVALGAGRLHLLGGGRSAPSPALDGGAPGLEGPIPLPPPPPASVPAQATPAPADEVSSTAESFAALPMDVRAVLLLRHIQDVDEPHIAWILDRPVATVTETLRRGEASLEERVGMATAGSA